MTDDPDLARLASDYRAAIIGDSPEARLLAAVPWYLGWHSEPPPLLQCLKHEIDRFDEIVDPPTFSLIAVLHGTPARWLEELILSSRLQSWLRWELILLDAGGASSDQLGVVSEWTRTDGRVRFLKPAGPIEMADARDAAVATAGGGFVAFVEDWALLHPCALGILARRLAADRSINMIRTNEAELNPAADRIARVLHKPSFDLFTLMRTDAVGRLAAIRRDLLAAAIGSAAVARPRQEGLLDQDLMIRIASSGQARVAEVPFFLYYRRAAPGASSRDEVPHDERRAMLEAWLPRIYPGAAYDITAPSPEAGRAFPGIHVRYLTGHPRPSLLAIVPFRDGAAVTLRCLESIERQGHELALEVLLIDNRSEHPATSESIASWLAEDHRNTYTLAKDGGAFNYGRIHNAAIAEHGRGRELVLFLNNDVELVSPGCLQTMAMQLLADESSGFVGIRLLYPDGRTVQHGGIQVCDGPTYVCGYHRLGHSAGVEEFANDERIAMGVTFACAMARRATFEALGGFDEVRMPNAYGDVDLCLRAIESGLHNHYFGTLIGIHHESRTRGRAVEDAEFVALHERHGATLAQWRLRGFARREVSPGSAPIGWPPEHVMAGEAAGSPASLPLRYRIADRIHGAVKRLAGRGTGRPRDRGASRRAGPVDGRRAARRGIDRPAADEGPQDDR